MLKKLMKEFKQLSKRVEDKTSVQDKKEEKKTELEDDSGLLIVDPSNPQHKKYVKALERMAFEVDEKDHEHEQESEHDKKMTKNTSEKTSTCIQLCLNLTERLDETEPTWQLAPSGVKRSYNGQFVPAVHDDSNEIDVPADVITSGKIDFEEARMQSDENKICVPRLLSLKCELVQVPRIKCLPTGYHEACQTHPAVASTNDTCAKFDVWVMEKPPVTKTIDALCGSDIEIITVDNIKDTPFGEEPFSRKDFEIRAGAQPDNIDDVLWHAQYQVTKKQFYETGNSGGNAIPIITNETDSTDTLVANSEEMQYVKDKETDLGVFLPSGALSIYEKYSFQNQNIDPTTPPVDTNDLISVQYIESSAKFRITVKYMLTYWSPVYFYNNPHFDGRKYRPDSVAPFVVEMDDDEDKDRDELAPIYGDSYTPSYIAKEEVCWVQFLSIKRADEGTGADPTAPYYYQNSFQGATYTPSENGVYKRVKRYGVLLDTPTHEDYTDAKDTLVMDNSGPGVDRCNVGSATEPQCNFLGCVPRFRNPSAVAKEQYDLSDDTGAAVIDALPIQPAGMLDKNVAIGATMMFAFPNTGTYDPQQCQKGQFISPDHLNTNNPNRPMHNMAAVPIACDTMQAQAAWFNAQGNKQLVASNYISGIMCTARAQICQNAVNQGGSSVPMPDDMIVYNQLPLFGMEGYDYLCDYGSDSVSECGDVPTVSSTAISGNDDAALSATVYRERASLGNDYKSMCARGRDRLRQSQAQIYPAQALRSYVIEAEGKSDQNELITEILMDVITEFNAQKSRRKSANCSSPATITAFSPQECCCDQVHTLQNLINWRVGRILMDAPGCEQHDVELANICGVYVTRLLHDLVMRCSNQFGCVTCTSHLADPSSTFPCSTVHKTFRLLQHAMNVNTASLKECRSIASHISVLLTSAYSTSMKRIVSRLGDLKAYYYRTLAVPMPSYAMATLPVFALAAGCSAWEAVNYCDGDSIHIEQFSGLSKYLRQQNVTTHSLAAPQCTQYSFKQCCRGWTVNRENQQIGDTVGLTYSRSEPVMQDQHGGVSKSRQKPAPARSTSESDDISVSGAGEPPAAKKMKQCDPY
ncbi:hypothetical protein EMCRGX_G022515 [Ephydatia muelleri]